jgi:hypothetical protein
MGKAWYNPRMMVLQRFTGCEAPRKSPPTACRDAVGLRFLAQRISLYPELNSDALEAPYYEANISMVETQLRTAGVRLATMLNAMFPPPADTMASVVELTGGSR